MVCIVAMEEEMKALWLLQCVYMLWYPFIIVVHNLASVCVVYQFHIFMQDILIYPVY